MPGARTGVEILGDEMDVGLIPLDPQIAARYQAVFGAGPIDGIRPWGGLYRQPALWVMELLDAGGGPLGQLVMANPDAALYSSLIGPFTEVEVLEHFFLGYAPGTEHWLWSAAAWPASFRLRGRGYPTEVLLAPAAASSYTIQAFDRHGQQVTPRSVRGGTTWAIHNGHSAGPVGALRRHADGHQTWFARPAFLVQGLIPPGPDGSWSFDTAGATSLGSGYVQLDLTSA